MINYLEKLYTKTNINIVLSIIIMKLGQVVLSLILEDRRNEYLEKKMSRRKRKHKIPRI